MSHQYIATDSHGIITVRNMQQTVVGKFTSTKNDDGTIEIFDADDHGGMPVAVVAAGADYLSTIEKMMEYAEPLV